MSDEVGQPPLPQVKVEGGGVEAAPSLDMGLLMERLELLIRDGDLQNLTIKSILQQLSKEFNVSFEKKEKELLKQRIHDILAELHRSDEDEHQRPVDAPPQKKRKTSAARSTRKVY